MSKVWIEVRTVFASLPERPPPVFAVTKPEPEFQYDYICTVLAHERGDSLMSAQTDLEEAQQIVRLSRVTGNDRSLSDGRSQRRTLAKGTVLDSSREEGGRVDFLPQVKPNQ